MFHMCMMLIVTKTECEGNQYCLTGTGVYCLVIETLAQGPHSRDSILTCLNNMHRVWCKCRMKSREKLACQGSPKNLHANVCMYVCNS